MFWGVFDPIPVLFSALICSEYNHKEAESSILYVRVVFWTVFVQNLQHSQRRQMPCFSFWGSEQCSLAPSMRK